MKAFLLLNLVAFPLVGCAANDFLTPATVVATTTSSPPPVFPVATGSYTPSPVPLPTATYTVSPEPALAPDCSLPNEGGQLYLLSDLEFRSLFTSDGKIDRALAANYPAWANYTQTTSWSTQPVKLGEIMVSASIDVESNLQINPAVTLITLGDSLNWQLPTDTDLYVKSREVSTAIDRLSFDWDTFQSESLRSQYPEVANGGTYALYAFLNYNLDSLQRWCDTYQQLFGTSP